MNNQPLVTVVTVIRNLLQSGRGEHFRQCVESVQNQDYPAIEHLLIDGASDDGTQELLREYEGKRGIRIISEPDSGIYDAMNKGLRAARGKYVAFLNSDDYWYNSHGVARSVESLERAQADFSYAPCRYIHADGTDGGVFMPELGCAFSLMPFCHQTMFTRADALREAGGFAAEQFKVAADYDMILHLLVSGCKPVFVPLDFTAFRQGGASFSRAADTEHESGKARRRQLLPLLPDDLLAPLEKGFMPQELFLSLASLLHPAAMASVADAHGAVQHFGLRPLLRQQTLTVHAVGKENVLPARAGKRYSGLLGIPLLRSTVSPSGMRLYLLFGIVPVLGHSMNPPACSSRWSLLGCVPIWETRFRSSGTKSAYLCGIRVWKSHPQR